MRSVDIYTDGACSGNPGPGGWACLLVADGHEKELLGHVENTTNNRMELLAVISGLTALRAPCAVRLHTDSAYVMNSVVKGWLSKWQANGWQTSTGAVKNQDLWEELVVLLAKHKVSFIKVKGHAGHVENERVDKLAVRARQNRV